MPFPRRLRRLDRRTDGTLSVFVAATVRSRLLGLALLDDVPKTCALLIPRCSSVHTFGMRFALDVTFLDADGRKLQTLWGVPPRRFVRHRRAKAVLERRAFSEPDRRAP